MNTCEKDSGSLTRRTASMILLISRVLASGTRLYFAGISCWSLPTSS